MNWKFWTKEFWVGSEPEAPCEVKEECVCESEFVPEPEPVKEVLEPYVFPNPALEFPALRDGETEEIHGNLSDFFEQVEVPAPPPPFQDNPVLIDAVLQELDKKNPKPAEKKRKRVKKDPMIEATVKTIALFEETRVQDGSVFSYKDMEAVKPKAAKKAPKKVAKKAPKKDPKKKTAKKK